MVRRLPFTLALVLAASGCRAYDRDLYGRLTGDSATNADARGDVNADAFLDVPNDTPLPDVPSACTGCTASQTCCDGVCIDINTDPAHCGSCVQACPGTTCSSQSCTGTCAPGRLDCDSNIVNGCEVIAANDRMHCGSCSRVCGVGQSCVGAECTCVSGFGDCDSDPSNACETDLSSSRLHCGACGHACAANQLCTSGACACDTGFVDCDGNAANGCEADTRSDPNHCGACGSACGPNAHCTSGSCACDSGWQRCPASSAACSVSTNDSANCGACGSACSGGTPVCMAGTCRSACAGGQTLCTGTCADLSSDPSHCGTCDTACPAAPHASASCTARTCGIACSAGFANCNGSAIDGCESDLGNDAAHCGSCGTSCPAAQLCRGGTCVCSSGQFDCGGGRCATCCIDSQCSGGCTGAGCSTRRACLSGSCVDVCATGFTDCAGRCIDLASDAENCGACGIACGPGWSCTAGMCSNAPASCADILARGASVGDGIYRIDPPDTGDPTMAFSVYCDMTNDGGGWTLALKTDGTLPTFDYDQAIWTDNTELNAASLDLSHTEAKFRSFGTVPFTALRVVFDVGAARNAIVVHVAAPSLLTGVNGPYLPSTEGRDVWQLLMPGETIQPNCGTAGLAQNLVVPYAHVRIGVLGNQETDCSTPDSFIGVGGSAAGNWCYGSIGQAVYSTGQSGGGQCVPGGNTIPAFGFVFVR